MSTPASRNLRVLFFGEAQDAAQCQMMSIVGNDILTSLTTTEGETVKLSLGHILKYVIQNNQGFKEYFKDRVGLLNFSLNMSYVDKPYPEVPKALREQPETSVDDILFQFLDRNFSQLSVQAGDEIAVIPPVSGG